MIDSDQVQPEHNKKQALRVVCVANILMWCTATAPVYTLSEGHITFQGLGVILGSLAVMNGIAGFVLRFFGQNEGPYFLRFAAVYFISSFVAYFTNWHAPH